MSRTHEQNERELLEALGTLGSQRTLAVVRRTRCNVVSSALRMKAERARSRQGLAITLLVLVAGVLLAAPVLWSFTEAGFGGSAVTDASILALTVLVALLSAATGVLLSRGRRRGAN